MLDSAQVEQQEERLRQHIRALPDAQRLEFFRLLEPRLKDPDTYAALNFVFIAGLHHFYLGRWWLGIMDLTLFWGGMSLWFLGLTGIGMTLVFAVMLFESIQLLRSQIIVKDFNNRLMDRLYKTLSKHAGR
ncbi:MAG: hypothetical protein RQ715_01770 [Methylococcales bacterium]|nr:hypothetical protein [Methylococcales bacterium]